MTFALFKPRFAWPTILKARRIRAVIGLVTLAHHSSAAEWRRFNIGSVDAPAVGAGEITTRWYRCYVRPPEAMVTPQEKDLWRDSMTLSFRGVEGTLSVWLNGRRIIDSGPLAAGQGARFKVPKGILEKDTFNAFVVRWQGAPAAAGFPQPPLLAGYFDELPLGPTWEVTTSEPSAAELQPLREPPEAAAYTEEQFRPATSPMQVAATFERGKFVAPDAALAALRTESDLVVEELLHEPEIAQPTHVSFDARGRAWVSQYRQYPYPAGLKMVSRDKYYRSKYDRLPPPPPHHDRGADIISVHEDTDGDGRYDKHTNVLTGLNMANAAVSGHGGLWIMHTPYLLFYPDANGDDIPDSDPEVRLAGFGLEDTHSVANGLAWGPDGWLYGAQGSTTTSRVVRPGIDPADFAGLYTEGCMVWRYHPERKIYEIFADGSGNTFGLSFDAEGRLFSGHNGGDTRGWHHIQDGLYLKQGKDPGKFGPAPNPFAFGEMPMMKSANSIPRFSHMLCVVEGTALPERWRGRFFAIDPLHHTVVAADRKREGSTYSTADIGFPLRTDDETFRPVFIANAPDGSISIADFREEYIAHGQNYQSQIDPDTGRLYRLRGRDQPLEIDIDLAAKSSSALVALLSHANIWHRQTAVRLLVERGAVESVPALLPLLDADPLHPALEALWVMHGLGRLDEPLALKCLSHPASLVRAWTMRLLGDHARLLPEAVLHRMIELARHEPDAEGRSQLLSTARRLPAAQALPLVSAVARRAEDIDDPFIPLMAWFIIESHCATNRDAVLALFDETAWWSAPLVRRHLVPKVMRRFAEAGTRQDFLVCARLLAAAPSPDDQRALLTGFEQAFAGRALPTLPIELTTALTASGLASPALRLRQGEPAAVDEAFALLADPAGNPQARIEAARTFGEIKHPQSANALLAISVGDPNMELRRIALGALSGFEAPEIAEHVAARWPELPAEIKSSALNLLVSRPAWAIILLDAVISGTVDRAALTPDLVTRLRAHPDAALAVKRDAVLTAPADPVHDPRARLDSVRRVLAQAAGDAYRGEPLYMSRCGACHTLFFKGGKIGPNLTSYQRDDLGTMLVSIIDPNAEIREGFENHLVTTTDGRSLSGFLVDSDSLGVILRGFDGTDLSLTRSEIIEIKPVGRSLMPEGLVDGLSDQEIRDLFAYLRQSQPITPQ